MRLVFILWFMACLMQGGSILETGGRKVIWAGGQVRFQVSRTVHLAGSESGVDRRESLANVHRAVVEAARAWSRAAHAAVSVSIEWTQESKLRPGLNLITFTDPMPFDSGLCDRERYIACTVLSYAPETGAIDGASIAFNPYMRHSSIGIKGTHDLGLALLHEIGHALGLDHSGLLDSVMAASVELDAGGDGGETGYRQLSSDDMLTLASAYARDASLLGVIQGSAARAGVHVVLLDKHGRPVVSAITNGEGNYRMLAGPGEYRMLAEPLDGPAHASQMVVAQASGAFPTLLLPETIVVEAGQENIVDFQIAAGPAVNAETVGIVQAGLYLGGPRITLLRGREYTIGVTRSPAAGPASLEILDAAVMNSGPASSPASAPQLVRQTVKIPAAFEPGAYTVRYTAEAGTSVLPGALRIVPDSQLQEVRIDGERLILTGTELATLEESAEPFEGAGAMPTQLAGVSVRIGDRLAGLVRVSPGEIIAEIPGAVMPDGTPVAVIQR
jgi:hypothetical protein